MYGSVSCQLLNGEANKTVSDTQCDEQGLQKPARPKKWCKKTIPCMEWVVKMASCPKQCVGPAVTLKGKAQCREKIKKTPAPKTYCKHLMHTQPSGAAVTKHCPCWHYVARKPATGCPKKCGYTTKMLRGTVTCERNGKVGKDAYCSKLPKPDTPMCRKVINCIEWKRELPKMCSVDKYACGIPARVHTGKVHCKETGGVNAHEYYCMHLNLKKPPPLTEECPKTLPCMKWSKEEPHCPKKCGHKRKIVKGDVQCQEEKSGVKAHEYYCLHFSLPKPLPLKRECPATPKCKGDNPAYLTGTAIKVRRVGDASTKDVEMAKEGKRKKTILADLERMFKKQHQKPGKLP